MRSRARPRYSVGTDNNVGPAALHTYYLSAVVATEAVRVPFASNPLKPFAVPMPVSFLRLSALSRAA
jgi:hypothetical protein